MSRALNFGAGPGTLPEPALEAARDELLDLAGSGMSVLEHSHRGKEYGAVHEEATALLRELAAIPESHAIVFLQGGASQQFAQVPLNLLGPGKVGAYVVNGAWGEKAVEEAKGTIGLTGGSVAVAASTGEGGKPKRYVRVPKPDDVVVPEGAAYLHVTSNETIHGVQFHALPAANVPVIADMSSDFLWRPTDLSKVALAYAGAQKNVGPSGLVVAVIAKELVEAGRRDIPKIFQYRTAVENDSLYNTPPTFSVYLVRNVLRWVKELGGLPEIERRNREKAALLYGAIDARPDFYACPVEPASRSVMNVVFRLRDEALEERFASEAKKRHRVVGVKGHRSVGGIRVSLYNAVPVDWVRTLVGFMDEFAREHG
jgi:phosphoserine aminotransferase